MWLVRWEARQLRAIACCTVRRVLTCAHRILWVLWGLWGLFGTVQCRWQVLSLQLLRFVYDASSGSKKKMNNTIK